MTSTQPLSTAIETLRLFNQKAERLNGLRFTASVRANKINCRYHFDADGVSIDRDLPDPEEIEAFVLTFRLFVQDNDGLSFRAVDALYESLPVEVELKSEVSEIRRQANDYLDGNTPVVLKNQRISRREVMDVFLYGGLAHANRDKAATFEAWKTRTVMFAMLESEFVVLLGVLLQAIFWLRQSNIRALEMLSALPDEGAV